MENKDVEKLLDEYAIEKGKSKKDLNKFKLANKPEKKTCKRFSLNKFAIVFCCIILIVVLSIVFIPKEETINQEEGYYLDSSKYEKKPMDSLNDINNIIDNEIIEIQCEYLISRYYILQKIGNKQLFGAYLNYYIDNFNIESIEVYAYFDKYRINNQFFLALEAEININNITYKYEFLENMGNNGYKVLMKFIANNIEYNLIINTYEKIDIEKLIDIIY